jgi:hypothetical protein
VFACFLLAAICVLVVTDWEKEKRFAALNEEHAYGTRITVSDIL